MNRIPAILITVAALFTAPSAFAEDESYIYTFDDDPLNAGAFGPNDVMLRVNPRPVRTTLIRPRTSFVPELLKTIEKI